MLQNSGLTACSKGEAMLRWGSSGGCLFVALFCVYGFVASGELQGTREILWKTGYAVTGAICFFGALWQSFKGK